MEEISSINISEKDPQEMDQFNHNKIMKTEPHLDSSDMTTFEEHPSSYHIIENNSAKQVNIVSNLSHLAYISGTTFHVNSIPNKSIILDIAPEVETAAAQYTNNIHSDKSGDVKESAYINQLSVIDSIPSSPLSNINASLINEKISPLTNNQNQYVESKIETNDLVNIRKQPSPKKKIIFMKKNVYTQPKDSSLSVPVIKNENEKENHNFDYSNIKQMNMSHHVVIEDNTPNLNGESNKTYGHIISNDVIHLSKSKELQEKSLNDSNNIYDWNIGDMPLHCTNKGENSIIEDSNSLVSFTSSSILDLQQFVRKNLTINEKPSLPSVSDKVIFEEDLQMDGISDIGDKDINEMNEIEIAEYELNESSSLLKPPKLVIDYSKKIDNFKLINDAYQRHELNEKKSIASLTTKIYIPGSSFVGSPSYDNLKVNAGSNTHFQQQVSIDDTNFIKGTAGGAPLIPLTTRTDTINASSTSSTSDFLPKITTYSPHENSPISSIPIFENTDDYHLKDNGHIRLVNHSNYKINSHNTLSHTNDGQDVPIAKEEGNEKEEEEEEEEERKEVGVVSDCNGFLRYVCGCKCHFNKFDMNHNLRFVYNLDSISCSYCNVSPICKSTYKNENINLSYSPNSSVVEAEDIFTKDSSLIIIPEHQFSATKKIVESQYLHNGFTFFTKDGWPISIINQLGNVINHNELKLIENLKELGSIYLDNRINDGTLNRNKALLNNQKETFIDKCKTDLIKPFAKIIPTKMTHGFENLKEKSGGKWPIYTFFLSLLQCIIICILEMFAIYYVLSFATLSFKDPGPLTFIMAYLVIFILAQWFQVYCYWNSWKLKNTMQIAAVAIFNLGLITFAVAQIYQLNDLIICGESWVNALSGDLKQYPELTVVETCPRLPSQIVGDYQSIIFNSSDSVNTVHDNNGKPRPNGPNDPRNPNAQMRPHSFPNQDGTSNNVDSTDESSPNDMFNYESNYQYIAAQKAYDLSSSISSLDSERNDDSNIVGASGDTVLNLDNINERKSKKRKSPPPRSKIHENRRVMISNPNKCSNRRLYNVFTRTGRRKREEAQKSPVHFSFNNQFHQSDDYFSSKIQSYGKSNRRRTYIKTRPNNNEQCSDNEDIDKGELADEEKEDATKDRRYKKNKNIPVKELKRKGSLKVTTGYRQPENEVISGPKESHRRLRKISFEDESEAEAEDEYEDEDEDDFEDEYEDIDEVYTSNSVKIEKRSPSNSEENSTLSSENNSNSQPRRNQSVRSLTRIRSIHKSYGDLLNDIRSGPSTPGSIRGDNKSRNKIVLSKDEIPISSEPDSSVNGYGRLNFEQPKNDIKTNWEIVYYKSLLPSAKEGYERIKKVKILAILTLVFSLLFGIIGAYLSLKTYITYGWAIYQAQGASIVKLKDTQLFLMFSLLLKFNIFFTIGIGIQSLMAKFYNGHIAGVVSNDGDGTSISNGSNIVNTGSSNHGEMIAMTSIFFVAGASYCLAGYFGARYRNNLLMWGFQLVMLVVVCGICVLLLMVTQSSNPESSYTMFYITRIWLTCFSSLQIVLVILAMYVGFGIMRKIRYDNVKANHYQPQRNSNHNSSMSYDDILNDIESDFPDNDLKITGDHNETKDDHLMSLTVSTILPDSSSVDDGNIDTSLLYHAVNPDKAIISNYDKTIKPISTKLPSTSTVKNPYNKDLFDDHIGTKLLEIKDDPVLVPPSSLKMHVDLARSQPVTISPISYNNHLSVTDDFLSNSPYFNDSYINTPELISIKKVNNLNSRLSKTMQLYNYHPVINAPTLSSSSTTSSANTHNSNYNHIRKKSIKNDLKLERMPLE